MPVPDLLLPRAHDPGEATVSDEMMDVTETAERFDVHPQTVYRWLRTGTFPCHAVRVGATWRINRKSVDEYLAGIDDKAPS